MRPNSQNLSIMITDIQGYTDTSVNSSRQEILELINNHNRLIKPVIDFYGGRLIKTMGDAFLCTFLSATDAVMCSIVIQLILTEYNEHQQDDSKKLKLRVVVNTGDVTLTENDIYGDAVNIAARMEGLECFPGGTIGISESTYLLMNRNEIVSEKIGPQELKGIPEPVVVYAVPITSQKLDKIPARILELVEKVVFSSKEPGNNISNEIDSILKTKNVPHTEAEEKVKEETVKNKKNKSTHASFVVPMMFLGIGLGFLFKEKIGVPVGTVLGLGSGFILEWFFGYIKGGYAKNYQIIAGCMLFTAGILSFTGRGPAGYLIGLGIGYLISIASQKFKKS